MRIFVLCLFVLTVSCLHEYTIAANYTIGPDGIDSSGLNLTGGGIGIGQVEPNRPGDPDTAL